MDKQLAISGIESKTKSCPAFLLEFQSNNSETNGAEYPDAYLKENKSFSFG